MPFTHVEIEERKSHNIALLFCFLVALYVGSILLLVWGVRILVGLGGRPTLQELISVFGLSLVFGVLHWTLSTRQLLARVLNAIGARPPDPRDTYHTKLSNIIEEVSVATGGRQIQASVIPTPAVNACAIADFDGHAAIAVTEGALAVLSRPQLESVIGHEVAHIVSGDSLTTSVLCGLFGLHEEALKRMAGLFGRESNWRVLRGRAAVLIVFVYLVLAVTNGIKTLCHMLISRQKEYRADAVAVRLTRNPLSLAEALHVMSKKWRGVGTQGESLSSIFIMDPGTEYLSEREGLVASLFSTHPPTERRIGLLLGMAHLDPARFDEEMSAYLARKRARRLPAPSPIDETPAQWMVWRDGNWVGPLGLDVVANALDLLPESWVRRVGEEAARPAHQDPQLLEVLRKRYTGSQESPSRKECPTCRVPLIWMLYEGAPIEECPACKGCYVDPSRMVRIFSREEYDFPEPIKRLGDSLHSVKGQNQIRKKFQAMPQPPLRRSCPRCGAGVLRKFYTEAYLVEVEQCWRCNLAWLDHQELELLQYLYEKRGAKELSSAA